jgi:hypothetical protein
VKHAVVNLITYHDDADLATRAIHELIRLLNPGRLDGSSVQQKMLEVLSVCSDRGEDGPWPCAWVPISRDWCRTTCATLCNLSVVGTKKENLDNLMQGLVQFFGSTDVNT